jgi:CO/xanthine dehydrogenase FAD-binding subunit
MALASPSSTRWQQYFTPASVADALALLHEHGANAQIIAGGTDLILDMQQGSGHSAAAALVDVTHIAGLDTISEQDGWIVLGAAVTHAQIEQNPLLRHHASALVESCGVVGGPQVRNVATLGGNVAHALPAADGTIGLLALGAEAQVSTWQADGPAAQWQPLLSLFAGPGRNTLTSGQMISAFRVPLLPARTGSAFDRIMRPQGIALPILGLAARVQVDETRTRVIDAAIAIGPAGPIPFRALHAEAVLTSAAAFDENVIDAAIAAAQGEVSLRTSKHRASREYREELLPVLLRRVLQRAFTRASAA